MIRLIGIAISIGLADSLNPSTIGPALYLAAGERPREQVIRFTAGVFAVYLVGGVLIALGPGQLILSLVPTPSHTVRHLFEILAGVVMIAAGLLLWRHRTSLRHREPPAVRTEGRSSALLGAGITAVELPTAFPYFAVIAAIVASPLALASQVLVLVLFNVCFILPLLSIAMALWIFGDEAQLKLLGVRRFLARHWPVVLAVVALVAGAIVIWLGLIGFAHSRGRLGRLLRKLGHHLPDIT